jgi:hypothetical protein
MALLQKAYLGAVPLFRQKDWFEDEYLLIDSGSATPIANTLAHTKGAWSPIISSTSADASLLVLEVIFVGASNANTATLLDLATGAVGSETVVAQNIAIGSANSPGIITPIPLKVASGTRLSCRIQSVVTGGKTVTVRAYLIDAGDFATAPTSVDVIGGNTANSQGISFSGASGTWTLATASTAQAYRAVGIVMSGHDANSGSFYLNAELGVGAAGSEQVFGLSRSQYLTNENMFSAPPYISLFGRNIPAGSRLAVRHDIASNSSRYGFTLIGVP